MMAGAEFNYNEFADSISPSEDDSEDNCEECQEFNDFKLQCKFDFYGFNGVDRCIYVYRVCRADEDISSGIFCKDPLSTRTIEEHVASGSKYGSKYISTTACSKKAVRYAFYEWDRKERIFKKRPSPLPVVRIDLDVLRGTEVEKGCVNLTNRYVREHFIKGATHRSWAISSKEVIFTKEIPKNVNRYLVYGVEDDLACPPQPPPRKEKKKKKNVLPDDLLTAMQNMGR